MNNSTLLIIVVGGLAFLWLRGQQQAQATRIQTGIPSNNVFAPQAPGPDVAGTIISNIADTVKFGIDKYFQNRETTQSGSYTL